MTAIEQAHPLGEIGRTVPRTSELHHFACPICGAAREISARALRLIDKGLRDGVCVSGTGCQKAVDRPERDRRYWLEWAGVPRVEIIRAGGAREYVRCHGLPHPLGSLL